MSNNYRKFLEKRYSGLYKRIISFDASKCIYCEFPRECLDHVPALSLLDSINLKHYLKNDGKLLLYPSCQECNRLLSNTSNIDFYSRLHQLSRKYDKKLDNREVWSETELNEMGPNMRTFIEANSYKTDELILKLENINKKITAIELDEVDIKELI
jgi:hypothetical protein